ncbi:sulfatase-like hydrolase/transferase [Fulvivirgaceae bacterium BMA12]|uniref:Sulfatase-like hydrolase/transferase n=1 Tax=Agaribacillus aureus TaxID=3051825 RepID=A0ABT8KZI0_9BACT|nr:sulfatase-like hydrolase/transferase [Fulvivirgaceae bacterium BMA12]
MNNLYHVLFPYGRFVTLNVVVLLALSITVVSFAKDKRLKLVLSSMTSLFWVLQLSSLYISHTFIGYSFIIHFNMRDLMAMIDIFVNQLLILFAIFLLSTGLIFFWQDLWWKIMSFTPKIRQWLWEIPDGIALITRFSIIGICIYIMTPNRGVVYKALDLLAMTKVKSADFEQVLKKLGMKNYIGPAELEARPGKNVIVVFLESCERGYLSDKMAHLTPNMRSLKIQWTYYNMQQTPGSQWTSGSLYTSLTGFPSFFDTGINATFQSTYHTHITSMSHVLKRAGYDMIYMAKDAQFAGTQEMLYTFQFDRIIDQSVLGEDIHDKDLFEKAKREIKLKTKQNVPFALFLSTLDTHFPSGNYDKRMEKHVPLQNTDLEFTVATADYIIGDFIRFLQQENMLSNTVVYILPDHLKMGSASIFEETGERSLYVITNAPYDSFSFPQSDWLYQIDMPKIFLEGAEIHHNARFLTDYTPQDKLNFIKENKFLITALNTSGINRIDFKKPYEIPKKSKNYFKYAKDTSRFIAHAGGMIDGKRYTNSLEALNLFYSKGFRLFELDIIKTTDGHYVAAHDWESWSKMVGYEGEIPVSRETFLKHKLFGTYSPMDMTMINNWFKEHKDAILVTDKINKPKAFSAVFTDKKRLMMELFSLEAVKEGLAAGIKSAMPSRGVIRSLKGNKADLLKKLGVTDIAISRGDVAGNAKFYEDLKKHGIKAYAFHINVDVTKDEKYVVKYEMDHIYGIYADNWNFQRNPEQVFEEFP